MSGGIYRPEGQTMHRPLPIRLLPGHATEPCASCGARGQSVCSAIDDQHLGRLAAVAVMRDINKGDTFIEEGTPARDFFNITRGTVKLFKLLPDGRQQVTGFAGIGHFLGLAVSDTYAFSAEAIEPVQLCRFSRPKLREVLHDFPALEERLLQTACNELVEAQEQMLLLGRKTARERVATFLVARCHAALPCGPSEHVALPMTRSEIADYLGLTIETVSRTFSRFKAEKRIATPSNSEVVILDRAWLDDMAAGQA
jgi:CRP/FNR family transcriptional regulator